MAHIYAIALAFENAIESARKYLPLKTKEHDTKGNDAKNRALYNIISYSFEIEIGDRNIYISKYNEKYQSLRQSCSMNLN